ncbi:MAG TPA: hypothetical protein VFN38_01605 [Gemmatimonadaceae bacterium]|nr:hypothetical protein [Gemmatimonadaceae bacterium]
MPSVPSLPTTRCTHDLGYGTTVCLRCRQEERDAARSRQQRLFALCGIGAMALLGVYVMGASAANAWRAATHADTVRVASRASVVASSVSASGRGEVTQQGTAATLVSSPVAAPAPSPSPAPVSTGAAPAAPGMSPPLSILVREGRSNLPDSLIAERGGDSVIVDFDTPMTRTRRRDKFETVVRRTLPMVFGAPIDSVLRSIPAGAIVGDADLLTELPKRGVHVPVADGWTLDLWPETRPGQDGPLVVSYRARVTRDGALR